mmetsp:Transcript_29298/g.77331  ORF Transcript_29298/g.77331 Transcript_29298/m.77331 type:complete len:263 (+) Transcript_29298:776-1564(+)
MKAKLLGCRLDPSRQSAAPRPDVRSSPWPPASLSLPKPRMDGPMPSTSSPPRRLPPEDKGHGIAGGSEGVGVASRHRERLLSKRLTARTTASNVAWVRLCCSFRLLIALPWRAVLSDTPARESSSSAALSPISAMIRALPRTACMPSRNSKRDSLCSKSCMQPSRTSRNCSRTLRWVSSSCAICETSSLSSSTTDLLPAPTPPARNPPPPPPPRGGALAPDAASESDAGSSTSMISLESPSESPSALIASCARAAHRGCGYP